ncbi:ADP-ribosylglycohydrolase family protein [Apibacter raozihei]|uniref:ADP-ribosylglycohydrolase family protein n=1 Tax=Apibacter raozihei TaxID=2500547 RepID=UPI002938D101|nr:ADP-ribosylglycohydrolase family protein [Apibacter raozihei]
MMNKPIHSTLFGVAIGDALGVPVEFKSREYLKVNPVVDMMGFMCWNQPPGTWSDDSSLTFCLADSLTYRYDLNSIAKRFVKWYKYGHWAAHGKVFDVGGSTRNSILRLIKGESPKFSGNFFEEDNGNGSLMRIIPLVFYLKDREVKEIFNTVKEVSGITHAHFRSVFSCFIYVQYAIEIAQGKDKIQAYYEMQDKVSAFLSDNEFDTQEVKLFNRILNNNIANLEEDRIGSSGYVLDSLEASIWCLLKEDTFQSTVLKAVNLGGDTDTTAAIAGGLAGLLYGFDAIPQHWINRLARAEDIKNLCDRLERNIHKIKK